MTTNASAVRGIGRLGRLAAIAGLAAAVTIGAGAMPVTAASNTASLSCGVGAFTLQFSMRSDYISKIAYRINGGAWQSTLYFAVDAPAYIWYYNASTGRWVQFYPMYGSAYQENHQLSGSNRIEAQEYKSLDGGRSYAWYNLGWCQTQDLYGNFSITLR